MRYVVATDGSSASDAAVTYAAEHAVGFDAALEIVHVLVPQTRLEGGQAVFEGEEAAIGPGKRTLAQAERLAADVASGFDAELEIASELLSGQPAPAIAAHAEDVSADAIYVGHRGLSSEREKVVGSVAKRVVDEAAVPVVVVR